MTDTPDSQSTVAMLGTGSGSVVKMCLDYPDPADRVYQELELTTGHPVNDSLFDGDKTSLYVLTDSKVRLTVKHDQSHHQVIEDFIIQY